MWLVEIIFSSSYDLISLFGIANKVDLVLPTKVGPQVEFGKRSMETDIDIRDVI
jgi:hypothetical protein